MHHLLRGAGLTVLIASAAACGGGGGSSSFTGHEPASGWTPGVFQQAGTFAKRCVAPRPGHGELQGRAVDENNWLRSWSHDLYLWYREVVDRDPALYATPEYFNLMKTTATTPSGTPKDNFHFSMPTDEWEALAGSGAAVGYGAMWAVVRPQPPRVIRVAYVEPNSPAELHGLRRGDTVTIVDGTDVVHDGTAAGVDAILAGLFPKQRGSSHTFTLQDSSLQQRVVTMTSEDVVLTPVPVVRTLTTAMGAVGYLLFNDHVATAERALIDAVHELAGANVADLVLDLRYNSGGFLVIASQLAHMIAGPAATSGKAFEIMRFNDKHRTVNPVTGAPLQPLAFRSTTAGLSAFPAGQPLPALNLRRVFVLTGEHTCSASESIINGLRGIDIDVVQIGATTCGKPYGFYPADNCGTTYFSIQFEGLNHRHEGGFVDGFSPAIPAGAPGIVNSGCAVDDDFERALGDTAEARLAQALLYRTEGTCADVAVHHGAPAGISRSESGTSEPLRHASPKPLWLQNRIMLE
jgi:carboxyl-terminal processing protease